MKKSLILVATLLFNCSNTEQIETERQTPTTYLTVKENPWLKGSRSVEGTLSNSATATDYANIVLIVSYYSEDDKMIGTERLVEYEILKSGESPAYERAINPPALTERLETIIQRAQFVDYENLK